jgi:hypothetical protein
LLGQQTTKELFLYKIPSSNMQGKAKMGGLTLLFPSYPVPIIILWQKRMNSSITIFHPLCYAFVHYHAVIYMSKQEEKKLIWPGEC